MLVALKNSYYGAGSGPVQFGGVQCLGNESTLLDCSYTASAQCSGTHDAGVMCPGEELLFCLMVNLLCMCCHNYLLIQSGPPLIYKHPQNVTVSKNHPVTFSCSATGIETPQIEWYKKLQNGTLQLLSHTGSYSISFTNPGAQKISSQLSISSVVFANGGSYVCKATSVGISSTSSAFLTILGNQNSLIIIIKNEILKIMCIFNNC